mgnify:FL=1
MLTVNGLNQFYGGSHILRGLSFDAPPGKVTVLLGRNGVGKTTLLKTLGGILPPISGDVMLGGKRMGGLTDRERARFASLLLTDPGLPPFLLGEELVSLGRTPHTAWFSSDEESDQMAVSSAMDRLHCTHLAHRRLGALSDGERQRLCLARVVAQDAPLLLLDEPTAHLDLPAKVEVLLTLRDLARTQGKAILASVHDVDLAFGLADRCLLLSPNAPAFIGTPEQAAGVPLHAAFPGWPDFWDPLMLRERFKAMKAN